MSIRETLYQKHQAYLLKFYGYMFAEWSLREKWAMLAEYEGGN